MNLEKLQERFKQVEKAMDQARANFNALEGAKQELLYWVGKLNENEEEQKKDQGPIPRSE